MHPYGLQRNYTTEEDRRREDEYARESEEIFRAAMAVAAELNAERVKAAKEAERKARRKPRFTKLDC